MDRILQEHPIAAWTLDEDFSATGPFENIDSFFTVTTSIVIPTQTPTIVSSIATISTSTAHGFQVGDTVEIINVVPVGYRKRYRITEVPTTTSFKIKVSTTGAITTAGLVGKRYDAYKLDAYNSERFPGYVISNKALSPRVPMVYGSGKSQNGSMLLPSFGFLSNTGKHNQYTFETWVKLRRTNSTNKYKLVGLFSETPTSDDGNGLYYNNTSFILKIGSKSDAAYIKQLDKPLLINITYSENSAQLFVNGEQVINIILEESDIRLLSLPANNKEYISLQSATFDCPAIYPYRLSSTQIKVHYAYGQAVVVPETINKVYGGKTISVDFPSAKYASNRNYPINAQWKNSVSQNLTLSDYYIGNKDFDLPNFNFYDVSEEANKTVQDFVSVLSAASQPWKPKYGSFADVNSNVEIKSLNIFNERLYAFYIDYNLNGEASTSEKTIFKVIDKISKNYFKITMQKVSTNVEIKYKFKYNSSTETTIASATQTTVSSSGAKFIVGIDIDKFAKKYGNDVRNFFGNTINLTMFALGDNDTSLDTTPDVTVNWIKFLNQFQLDKWSQYFVDANGRFFCPANATTPGTAEAIQNASIANYELKYIQSKQNYNTSYTYSSQGYAENYFSIGTSGYWKSDTPLEHFAKYVRDAVGQNSYTFNSIQFNIDYDSPVANTTASFLVKHFDLTNSNVKAYVTFEPILEPYKPDSYFSNGIERLSIDRTVRPDENWATTKYEVVDGTIIYPPSSVDLSTLTLVTHIEVTVSDTVNNKVQIKSLELASQALSLNPITENPVYTKYGNKIIPYTYTLNGSTKVYDYSGIGNARNPFLIEKKTSPHLSLDRLSGIRLVGFDFPMPGVYRGIKIPLNEKLTTNSRLSSVQMFIYYDATADADQSNREAFQFDTQDIFKIVASDKTLTATLTNTSGVSGTYNSTATLSISSTAGGINENIKYYINGELSATPTIKTNEWTVLSVVFSKPLKFDSFAGEFDIVGPLAFDNISFYGFSNEQLLQSQIEGTWADVELPNTGPNYTWDHWLTSTWLDLTLIVNPETYPISADKIYGMYTGTNILYPGQYDQLKRTSLQDVQYSLYSGYTTSKYLYSAN